MKIQTTALLTTLVVSAAAVGEANAALITWGSATAVSTGVGNSSDVSTTGTLVEAYNGALLEYAGGDQVVNGVLFKATTKLLNLDAGSQGDFSDSTNGGDAAYDAILSTLDFGNGPTPTIVIGDGDGDTSVTGAGLLVDGRQYEIQVWFVDNRSAYDSRVMDFASTNSDTQVSLNDQFAIGTFTADGTTQTLYLETNSFGNAQLTAYQIREVPEPGSLALLGLGGLMCIKRRRRAS